jgi:hypothetical protein
MLAAPSIARESAIGVCPGNLGTAGDDARRPPWRKTCTAQAPGHPKWEPGTQAGMKGSAVKGLCVHARPPPIGFVLWQSSWPACSHSCQSIEKGRSRSIRLAYAGRFNPASTTMLRMFNRSCQLRQRQTALCERGESREEKVDGKELGDCRICVGMVGARKRSLGRGDSYGRILKGIRSASSSLDKGVDS